MVLNYKVPLTNFANKTSLAALDVLKAKLVLGTLGKVKFPYLPCKVVVNN